jgi:hypothetical protein
VGFHEEIDPQIFKQERHRGFKKYGKHMCSISEEEDFLMPYTAETIQLKYVRTGDWYAPLVISPLRPNKKESLPFGIMHR